MQNDQSTEVRAYLTVDQVVSMRGLSGIVHDCMWLSRKQATGSALDLHGPSENDSLLI